MRSILRYIALSVTAIVIGVTAFGANAKVVAGNDMPMPFGYGASVVLTGSMEPVISANDMIVVKETTEYGVGDIIVYRTGRMSVVHRVIGLDGDRVITQGDANNAADEPFDRSAVIGRVIAVVPGVGRVIRLIRTPAGIVVLVALVVLLMEGSFRKKKEADREEADAIRKEILELKLELERQGAEAPRGTETRQDE